MILRDMYCLVCGRVVCDVECDGVRTEMRCDGVCDGYTVHAAVCNGGLRSRYRFADWPSDPEFYRGQGSVVSVEATDSEGEPVRRYTSGTREIGEPMHDAAKYKNGSDERETKRDQVQYATRRKRGRSPIVCDLGGRGN